MKTILYIAGGILLAIPVVWLVRNSRALTPTVAYRVVRAQGAFELRDYPALTLAQTPMNGDGGSGSFGRLFAFITGKNTKSEKIPMTTPVLIDPAPGHETMSFVMPGEGMREGVPQPGSSDVVLRKMEPGRYAVLRFRGGTGAGRQQVALQNLQTWIRAQGLLAQGEPVFAYYDPPWTPGFLRRNEVMIRVESGRE